MAETYGTITREELKAKLEAKDEFVLIEVLPQAAYEHAHLPSAINIPLQHLRTMVPRLVPSTWKEIVVYCASPT
jgi:rhodanese-related sulfurtransferase